MRTYAIGDIHGQIELLLDAHDRIARDRRQTGDTDAVVVHVGDLVDRGPDSRAVVDYLRTGIEAGENWVVLKGNHDRMFAGYLSDIGYHDAGLRLDLSYLNPRIGGAATLASYGVRSAADFQIHQRIMRPLRRPDQFVQLQLDRRRIAVLGVLDQEDHQEGHDRRPGIDHQLPGIGKSENRPRHDPDKDHPHRQHKGRWPPAPARHPL
jgi:hypothetical protein